MFSGVLRGLLLFGVVCSCELSADSNRSQYDIDKDQFEYALQQKSIPLFNEFIKQRPNTVWMENARYYRDKLALASARSEGTEEALNQFLQDYPDSAWVSNAIHYRDKFAKQSKKQSLLEQSRELSARESKFDESKKDNESRYNGLSAEQLRVQKALAIYEQINKEKQLAAASAESARIKKEKEKRDCIVMNDQLRSFDERKRWYSLDDQGNRIYLSDEDVSRSKSSYGAVVARKCGGV